MPSTVIDTLAYDEHNSMLEIRFQSGSIYQYKNVPKTTYQAMRRAQSKGTFLNEYIKGKFDFERLK